MGERKTGLTSIRAHAAIYLTLHACSCFVAFLWSMLCYKYWAVHTAYLMVLLLSVVWVGAGYYMYMFKMSTPRHYTSCSQPRRAELHELLCTLCKWSALSASSV